VAWRWLLIGSAVGCGRLSLEGTPFPDRFADWEPRCWVDGAVLSDAPLPEIVPGSRAVLFGEARYAESWLRTEYAYAELLAEVDPPTPGARIPLDRAKWVEGGQGGSTAWPLTGAIEIRAVDPASLTLDLDASSAGGRSPSIRELVDVRRVPSAAACFRSR
jgi:hypothetical protein